MSRGQDKDISAFIELLTKFKDARPGPEVIAPESQDVKLFWTMWDDFFLRDDILYRRADPKYGVHRYVVPLTFQQTCS